MKFITQSGTTYEVFPKPGFVLTGTAVSEKFDLVVTRRDGMVTNSVPFGGYKDCFWLSELEIDHPVVIGTKNGAGTITTTPVTFIRGRVSA